MAAPIPTTLDESADSRDRYAENASQRTSGEHAAFARAAACVAHDVNNLLGVIIGYSELLTADLAGFGQLGEALEDAHEIREAAARAAELVCRLSKLGERESARVGGSAEGGQDEPERGELFELFPPPGGQPA